MKKHLIKRILKTLAVVVFFQLNGWAQNKMDNNQNLDAKQQSIISISALTATGNIEQLKTELNSGLDAGLTINEIKDELVQLYAYCGFPRSLNAINTFMTVADERKANDKKDIPGKEATPIVDNQKYQTGKNTLQKLTGREETALSGANAFAPAIDVFLKEHLFADIFSRDVLNYQQRELITVAALAAMTGVEPQLQAHIGIAMNTGITEMQLLEAFTIIDEIISKKQGDIARLALSKVVH
ncbi:carboxymuconolactone decarboxylase family protein [Flavobacterium araucananum]|uniref:Carboxymuconolactone decarboxylase n=1 Tax=Flavobacterium araucananum TaxID=946678 RepID=A0A227P415_9FLAO|nr:carboxymuconolactone decarboxylase family protein [Flavobacterium araucananum]OXG03978.1 carboxymuconolactone decarboxylase [Flavobacterium araucananum]PWJ98491.1 carboxymuconolactone decarboxylase family protein [Flavobacterium araucananum]